MIGTSIEHYQIVERLGQGGMGAVYRATDTLLEREVALKLLRPEYASDPTFAERFRAEAVTLAKLSHPNIATLYGFVKDATQLCMVMELATGETLTSVLKRSGAMSWERSILLVGQMLDALQYAHERGVVHRDIKPSNLMVGQDDHLKLMDFGIARLMGTTRVTQMGFTVGTLEYMAPEQIRGEDVDGRADIYATGVVLYEMVTGQLPFKSSREQALMFAHLQQEVVPPRTYRPNLPWHLSDVIVRALAKAPGDRFASAREFSDALGASIGSSTATVRVPVAGHTVTGASASPRRRTAVSQRVAAASGGYLSHDATTTGGPVPQRQGWLGKWWPTFRVSSNRFGGANEPGVMYQAEVGAGGFGGAIRIVAVRMTTAGRRAVSRATEVMRGATSQLVRHPAFLLILLLGIGVGGGWYWKQRQAKADETTLSAAGVGVTPAAPAPATTVPPPAPEPTPAPAPSAAAPDPVITTPPPVSPAPDPAPVTPPVTRPAPTSSPTSVAVARVPVSTTSPAATNRGGPSAGATAPAVEATTAAAPAVPDKPAMPAFPDVKLENTVTLLTPKEDDVEETEGTLTLHGNEIIIIDDDNIVLRTVRLRADGPGKGQAASGPAQIYTHRRDRWLVLPLVGGRLVVQIDRDDIPKLTAALESRLGRPVTTVEGEPQFPKH